MRGPFLGNTGWAGRQAAHAPPGQWRRRWLSSQAPPRGGRGAEQAIPADAAQAAAQRTLVGLRRMGRGCRGPVPEEAPADMRFAGRAAVPAGGPVRAGLRRSGGGGRRKGLRAMPQTSAHRFAAAQKPLSPKDHPDAGRLCVPHTVCRITIPAAVRHRHAWHQMEWFDLLAGLWRAQRVRRAGSQVRRSLCLAHGISASGLPTTVLPVTLGRSMGDPLSNNEERRPVQFIVNANLSSRVVDALIGLGHEAVSAASVFGPRFPDRSILEYAHRHTYVVVTKDTDFGALVHKEHMQHAGVILVRPQKEEVVIARLLQYLARRGDPSGKVVSLR